jgi:cytochrome b pre-mRNA-processing protein 3
MIVLHLALVLERTEAGSEAGRALGQAVFDRFCSDMDGHLRETGISDLKVPREMKEIGKAFYGRRGVYREALAAPDNRALAEALARNIYGEEAGADTRAIRLAAYVRAAAQSLSQQHDIDKGRLTWPDPAAAPANAAS